MVKGKDRYTITAKKTRGKTQIELLRSHRYHERGEEKGRVEESASSDVLGSLKRKRVRLRAGSTSTAFPVACVMNTSGIVAG